jgi:outer membrane lipoprotein carrier protein
MHAHFHEVAQSPEGERTADGELFIQKPGKFYWENTSPSSEYFLSDGETLWHYQPDLLQATKSSLSGALDQTPLLLLSGKVADISELFSVSELSPGEFLLIPKNKNNNANQDNLIQSITLKFNAGKLNPGELESFSLKSALGQETTVTFSQVEWNLPIQASKFKFTLPPGSDLFEG